MNTRVAENATEGLDIQLTEEALEAAADVAIAAFEQAADLAAIELSLIHI